MFGRPSGVGVGSAHVAKDVEDVVGAEAAADDVWVGMLEEAAGVLEEADKALEVCIDNPRILPRTVVDATPPLTVNDHSVRATLTFYRPPLAPLVINSVGTDDVQSIGSYAGSLQQRVAGWKQKYGSR